MVDETDCFSKTGTRRVYWDMDDINDWYYKKVADSQSQCWFVRCRLTSVTGLTEGGHQESGYYLQFPKRYYKVVGGTETDPITLKDIYNHDITHDLTLLDTTISASPEIFNLQKMIRPPKVPTRLHIICTARSGATATITGLDEQGNTITETIDISSGDTWTDCAFTWVNNNGIEVSGLQVGDSFSIKQPRKGIVEFRDPNLYVLHGGLQIGDGSTSTYFTEKNKQIYASRHIVSEESVLSTSNNAVLVLGELNDESRKLTSKGCYVQLNYFYPRFKPNYIYSSTVVHGTPGYTEGGLSYVKGNFRIYPMERIWNSVFDKVLITYSGLSDPSQSSIYNIRVFRSNLDNVNSGVLDKIEILNAGRLLYLWRDDYVSDLSNIYAILTTDQVGLMGSTQAITKDSNWDNCDIYTPSGEWKFYWSKAGATGKVYRRYDFDLKVVDESGNPIENANVKIYDVDETLIYDGTTDSNGEIPTQKVTYAYYTSDEGASGYGIEVLKSPHTLVVSKDGYQTYEVKLTINQKRFLTVRLYPINSTYFDVGKGKVIKNLNPSDPTNKKVLSL